MKTCGTCKYYEPNNPPLGQCSRWRKGYHWEPDHLKPNEVVVEDDERLGSLYGPRVRLCTSRGETMTTPTKNDLNYLIWLVQQGYTDVTLLPDGVRWAAVKQFMFTYAICVGKLHDQTSYDDRWCYYGKDTAAQALNAWKGIGEPDGWHRHPASGRRRDPDGNEYVNY